MRNPAQRNNNPLNLRFANQTEAQGFDKNNFALFPTPEAGWRAAHAQINLDKSRGLTLREFIFKFAPPVENNTNDYLNFVASQFTYNVDTSLSAFSTYALAGVMAQFEGYYNK